MADIDSLSIEISASTKSAASALDTLITRLGALSTALGRMSTGHFDTQINSAADALMNLGAAAEGLDAGRITSVASGLAKLSDAGSRLVGVGEGATAISQVADGITTLNAAVAAVPDAEAITHLAGAIKMLGGDKATNASFVLGPIADALRAFEGIAIPDVQGLTNLAYALRSMGSKHVSTAAAELPIVANALRSFQDITVPDVTGISELATAIGQLGKASVQKAATNIPAVATAFRTLLAELSNVPQVSRQTVDLANALGQLAQGSNRVNSTIGSVRGTFTTYSAHANRARLSTLSLTAAVAKLRAIFFALRRVFGFVKEGMKYYSDLVEVQNVVDVTFGQMASKMEALTNTSIKTLGMSELTAKQIGARFQAMGSAMGITQQQVGDASAYLADKVHKSYAGIYNDMSDVSINLTKLAADMASFYNVEQADVAKDLESVFTGMTRPLRKYGWLKTAA